RAAAAADQRSGEGLLDSAREEHQVERAHRNERKSPVARRLLGRTIKSRQGNQHQDGDSGAVQGERGAMSVRMAKSKDTSIVLADDHAVVRQGLRALLDAEPGLTVVGEAADGIAAVDLVEKLRPAVLVVDIMMPGLGGLDVTQQVT